jgi:hypothetical protein
MFINNNRHNNVPPRQHIHLRRKQFTIPSPIACRNNKPNIDGFTYMLLLLRITTLMVGIILVSLFLLHQSVDLNTSVLLSTNWTNVSYPSINVETKVGTMTTTTTKTTPATAPKVMKHEDERIGDEEYVQNSQKSGIDRDTSNSYNDDNNNQLQPAVHDTCDRMKNVNDIQLCYPSQYVKRFNDPQCQTIQDWDDVQRCLMGRYYYNATDNNNNNQIREVHILGERNSGTKFITQFLQQCYPSTISGIKVHRDLIRSKHFFQPIWPLHDFTHSLIVVVVRDPIEWMAAMRENPYHSPSHIHGFTKNGNVIPLPWSKFVNKTWTTESTTIDRTLQGINRTNAQCPYKFRYHEVKPCILTVKSLRGPPWYLPISKMRGYAPVYEQRRGKPYDHLLQLRSDKIVNWVLQIPLIMQIGGFILVRYEDILTHGNGFFLKQVNAIIHNRSIDSQNDQPLPDHCSIIEPQPDRIGKRYIPPAFKEWISHNLDVETERLLGYR